MSDAILTARSVTQQFGGLTAVNEVDFDIFEGEIVGIIGPNGAGKTTFFNVLTGIYNPTAGKVHFHGRDITGQKTYNITALGLARTFQNIRLFPHMTALETVMVGMHTKTRATVWESLLKLPRHRKTEREAQEKALEVLKLAELDEYRYEYGTSLPYGMQRRLEIARAMAAEPEILLLDEPAAGMNEQETRDLMGFIRKVRGLGYTVLLIEHDMRLVMNLCERIYVLDHGTLIATGDPAEIKANPRVVEAYLGKEDV